MRFGDGMAVLHVAHRSRCQAHEFAFDVGLAVSGVMQVLHRHRRQHQHHVAAANLRAAERGDRVPQYSEYIAGRAVTGAVADQTRTLDCGDGDDRIVGLIAVFNLQRFPQISVGVFCDTETVIARMALRGLAGFAGKAAPDIPQNEADGAADGSGGAVAVAERTFLGVEAEAFDGRSADDGERCTAVGSGLHAIEIEAVINHRFDGGDDDGHVFGFAAGHHAIDGDGFDGGHTVSRLDHADHFSRIALEVMDDAFDRTACRWYHRQTVGPFVFKAEFGCGFEIGGFKYFCGELHGWPFAFFLSYRLLL